MKSILRECARIANGGAERNFRFGCIIKRSDGAFISARNERTKEPNPAAHAEYRALKKADYGCTLWVARINADNSWTMARPCPRCRAFIISKGVAKVYYTISPGEYGVWYPGKTDIGEFQMRRGTNSAIWEVL